MTREVQANTDDLEAFVTSGQLYVDRLGAILDTVRDRRLMVMAAMSEDVGIDSVSPFEELLAEATITNRFVDTIHLALTTYRFTGSVKTAPVSGVSAALAAAGLDVVGPDFDLTDDQLLAQHAVTGPVGDDALRLLGGWMNAQGMRTLSANELEAMALVGVSPAPDEVRQAARYLYQNPDLHRRVAGMSGTGSISVDDLETTIIVNQGLRVLADRETFRVVDANGDGRITSAEVAGAEGTVGPERFAALQQLNGPDLGRTYADGVSYTDVVGAVINRHALAHDPDAAYRFVTQLPATFDDLSGKTTGFDIRLVDDDALRALAGAALGGADGLVEQTLVVSYLPESQGGVRNLLITAHYAEIAKRMNHRLNAHIVDPLDPGAVGHSGAPWAMMGTNASNGVRPVITGDISAFGFSPSRHDRQSAADGNQYIFGTIGPAYAAFLEAFPAGDDVTEDVVKGFLDARLELGTRHRLHRLFRPGQADLRDGFVHYVAALEERDPQRRQELVFVGNLLLATSEQGGAQNWIEKLTDLDWSDDGWRAAGQALSWLVGGDEAIATDQMVLPLGIPTGTANDDAETFKLARDVPARPGVNNTLAGVPLVEFDPTAEERQVVTVGQFTVGLEGVEADVTTATLQGWDDPPAGTNMNPLPASVVDWAAGGDGNFLIAGGTIVEEGRGGGDGINLSGTGAIRWNDWEDRQWYIANLFHQFHTDPALFNNLGDFTVDRHDIHGKEALTAFLPPDVLFELDGGGQR